MNSMSLGESQHLPKGTTVYCIKDQHIDDKHSDRLSKGHDVLLENHLILPFFPLHSVKEHYWHLYKRLVHKVKKDGKSVKLCPPNTVKLFYPENPSGYVLSLRKQTSVDVTLQSSPPDGCDGSGTDVSVSCTYHDVLDKGPLVSSQVKKKASVPNQGSVTVENRSDESVSPNNLGKKEIQSRTLKILTKTPCKDATVLTGLKSVISLDRVEAIGTHGKNTEHYVTFKSKTDTIKPLTLEFQVDGNPAIVESVDKEEVIIRIHWLPYWCENTSLANEMGKYGRVLKVMNEKIASSDEESVHIVSSVRRVYLSCQGGQIQHIPHVMKYEGKDVLLTIRGRPPFCLKCKNTGHIRASCKTPYCNSCKIYGHETKGCEAALSYAARLKGKSTDVITSSEDHVDPQEDCEQSALGGDSEPLVKSPPQQVTSPTSLSHKTVASDIPPSSESVETAESTLSTPPPKRKRKTKVSRRDSTISRARGMEGIETAPGNSPYPGFDLDQFDWVDPTMDEDPPDSVQSIHTPGTQTIDDNT